MALPKYNEMYRVFLETLQDGKTHAFKDIRNEIAKKLQLSPMDLRETISSGQNKFYNRVNWTATYLKKAGLAVTPSKGKYHITPSGKKVLADGAEITNDYLAVISPEFAAFINYSGNGNGAVVPVSATSAAESEQKPDGSVTPEETLQQSYEAIRDRLCDELLSEIMDHDPAFFEKLAVDLLEKMGYGSGFVTKDSRDDGVDGYINEDRLGFSVIYMQAKRLNPETKINKSAVQNFAGAMMGPPKTDNGLFITTAKFTEGAKEYANAQHIILVDGHQLCELMIEYGVGVTTVKNYAIKRIDSDYFSDE